MGKHPLVIGVIAAAIGCLAAHLLWALSEEHSPWTALLFALFPTPVLVETARLVALYAIFGPTGAGRGGLRFAFGFALVMGLVAGGGRLHHATIDAFLPLAFLSSFALHYFLSLTGVAIKALNGPPMAIFCVLAIIHGAHNGAMIAAERELEPLTAMMIHVAAAAAYGALALWLARGRMSKVAREQAAR